MGYSPWGHKESDKAERAHTHPYYTGSAWQVLHQEAVTGFCYTQIIQTLGSPGQFLALSSNLHNCLGFTSFLCFFINLFNPFFRFIEI